MGLRTRVKDSFSLSLRSMWLVDPVLLGLSVCSRCKVEISLASRFDRDYKLTKIPLASRFARGGRLIMFSWVSRFSRRFTLTKITLVSSFTRVTGGWLFNRASRFARVDRLTKTPLISRFARHDRCKISLGSCFARGDRLN